MTRRLLDSFVSVANHYGPTAGMIFLFGREIGWSMDARFYAILVAWSFIEASDKRGQS